MMKFLIGLVLATASLLSQAATYYVCNLDGDDARTSAQMQSSATPAATWAGLLAKITRAGGDVFRFCRGGTFSSTGSVGLASFTGTTSRCTPAAPCTWESYTSSAAPMASSTVTISNASPAVVTWNAHGLANGDQVTFSTTGSLPAGIQPGITYYVMNAATNTFQVSRAGPTGANRWAASTTTAGSGTHTATKDTRPVIAKTTSGSVISGDDGNTLQDGGYIFRNIKVECNSVANWGFFLTKNLDNLFMDNIEIANCTNNGVFSQNHLGGTAPYWNNTNIRLTNSYLHHNSGSAWLGGGERIVIENNVSHNNGSSILDHEWYFSSIIDSVFRGNVLFDTVDLSTGDCGGSVVVVHGFVERFLIEGNLIWSTQSSSPQCYGIEVDQGYNPNSGGGAAESVEGFRDVVVRGNQIINVGYSGIAIQSVTRFIAEDNVIVWTNDLGKGVYCVGFGNTPNTGDETNQAITIRNNSCYMNSSSAVASNQKGIYLPNVGTNHVVTNNLILFGPNSPTNSACYALNSMPLASFTAFDNNLCWSAATATVVYSDTAGATWAGRTSGFDTNGVNADPLLSATPASGNGYSMAVQAGSPAVNAGHTTHKSRLSFGNKVPVGGRDIGAYDFGATVVAPYSPAATRAQ